MSCFITKSLKNALSVKLFRNKGLFQGGYKMFYVEIDYYPFDEY